MINIYSMPEKYKFLESMLDDDSEGAREAFDNARECMQDELLEVSEYYSKAISNINALNEGAQSEVERINSLIKSRKEKVSKIKSALLDAMISTGLNKITTSIHTLSVREGSKKTVIHDESLIPDSCMDVKTVIKPLLKEVKKLIEEGKINSDAAEIVRSDKTLTIK
jgi:hypothetical protein